MITGVSLVAGVAWAADTVVPFADSLTVPATAAVGNGTGTLTVRADQMELQAKAETLGQYTENWHLEATVLDYLLPETVALSPECDRLSLEVANSYEKNQYPPPMLRILVRDARNELWAFNTRLQGLGTVPFTKGFERVETFPWDTTELGRVEPWVMLPAAGIPATGLTPPVKPLRLAGFRLIVPALKAVTIQLRNLTMEARGTVPDPYWLLTPETSWMDRTKSRGEGRFGWGPREAGPYLRGGDLNLSTGAYSATWEILAADGWTPVASGAGPLAVRATDAPAFTPPLLANGTYHLRLNIIDKAGPLREFFYQYVVVRNSRGGAADPSNAAAAPKPLSIEGSAGVVRAGENASVKVTAASPALPAGANIAWELQTADGRVLASGKGNPNEAVTVPLAPLLGQEQALWLKADLSANGKILDRAWRVFGTPTPVAVADSAPVAKPKWNDRIWRTKGDWHEGSTPIVTKASEILEQFRGWLDEAQQIGYNSVELSATWAELEPLPGVYLFSYLDRLVAEAQQRGLAVVLRVHPIPGCVPQWVPREFQEDENRLVHGLWSGGSNLTYTAASTALTTALNEYLTALAAHYRTNPTVVGYTLANLFFDHGWHDLPWLGQNVDYSETMRQAFVRRLKTAYNGDLQKAATAHGRTYNAWEDIALPHPQVLTDADGRLRPRTDALWRDWMDAKLGVMADFRFSAVDALRQGDPACLVGPYRDPEFYFVLDGFVKRNCFVAQGSMEEQYPPELYALPLRYEPHAKIARTRPLVDVGLTNLLFRRPGANGFYNYWFPEKRLATVSATEREAELRLQEWFKIIDRLTGAKPLAASAGERRGALVFSLASLTQVYQHSFTGRTEDPLKPFNFRAGAEKRRVDQIPSNQLTPEFLANVPYVYLPYCADVLEPAQLDALTAYVSGGGKLILEATSGFWSADTGTANALGQRFGMPAAVPQPWPGQTVLSEAVKPEATSPLAGVPVAFRVAPFQPPINEQASPWIHNIPKHYLRPFRLPARGLPATATRLANAAGGSPAVVQVKVGKGDVLFFAGTIDWLACPGLASRLDDWGTGRAAGAAAAADPAELSAAFEKDGKLFLLGRRFIGHEALSALKQGKTPEGDAGTVPLHLRLPQAPAPKYTVRELLTGREFGEVAGTSLVANGVVLELLAGQGFVLEAIPVK